MSEGRGVFCMFSCIGDCEYFELYIFMVWDIDMVLLMSCKHIDVFESAEKHH